MQIFSSLISGVRQALSNTARFIGGAIGRYRDQLQQEERDARRNFMSVDEKISRNLWLFAGGFIILGVTALLSGHWVFAFLGAIGCAMIARGIKVVPADPPNILLLTVWGRRIPVILREQVALLAPYFPLMINGILVPIKKQDADYQYDEVRCKGNEIGQAGGAVGIKVSVTYEPDYRADDPGTRIVHYLNSGGKSGVDHILADVIGKTTRNVAGLYTWEELTFLLAGLEAALLMRVADTQFRLLPRTADGRDIQDSAFDIDPEEYERLPIKMRDPLNYLNTAPSEEERAIRQKELGVFLKCAQVNGGGDIMDLGVRIMRLNVVKILPEGELATDAEATAREKKQREGETMDIQTEISLAELYLEAAKNHGETISLANALQWVRVNRGRAKEFDVNSPGNPLAGAAAVNASRRR